MPVPPVVVPRRTDKEAAVGFIDWIRAIIERSTPWLQWPTIDR